MQKNNELIGQISLHSAELGFSACGIVPVSYLSGEEEHLRSWLDRGFNGRMEYLSRDTGKRADPGKLTEGAKTLIMVLQNHYTPTRQSDPAAPVISRYAWGRDYHGVMTSKLRNLLSFIREMIPGSNGRTFTDSSPVLEKAWASRAGLGWIGKNSLLISPEYGSFCFLGGIMLDCVIPGATPELPEDRCGQCTLCLEACPTGALVDARILDARRCISYQTVENKEGPDDSLKGSFRNRVFGCDICQEVCPWNRKAKQHQEAAFHPSPELLDLSAQEWDLMDPSLFNRLFAGSPVERTGYEKLKKNIDFLKCI